MTYELKYMPCPGWTPMEYEAINPTATPAPVSNRIYFRNNICRRRAFFTTENGRFSMGIESTKPGDSLCIPYGGITPFILRGKGPPPHSHHRLISECYVAGLMQGAAIADHAAGRLKEQEFRLR